MTRKSGEIVDEKRVDHIIHGIGTRQWSHTAGRASVAPSIACATGIAPEHTASATTGDAVTQR